MTVADALIPQQTSLAIRRAYQIALVVLGSALISLSAQLEFPLPFSPVPITGQTFGVLLTAMLLGRTRGTAAIIAYLVEGFSGLPVFAGGAAGLPYVMGPTGGYLIGFIPAAFVVGWLADHGWDKHILKTVAAMAAGTLVILVCGATQLAFLLGGANALAMGVVPFLIGDGLKIAAAAVLLPSIRRFSI